MTNTNKNGPVGYGNPPDHSKFQKGKSGNPSGRRKTQNQLVLDDPIKAILFEEITVVVKGKKVKMSAFQALLSVLRAKGLKGDTKAIQMLFTQTDGLRSLVESVKYDNYLAQREFIDAVLKANEWMDAETKTTTDDFTLVP